MTLLRNILFGLFLAVAGPLAADDINISLPVSTGTYTPVATGLSNLDAVTPTTTQWFRVGNMVTVFGTIQADATAAAAASFRLNIPIAANFATANQAGGSLSSAASMIGRITSDATNDDISIAWNAVLTTNVIYAFHFSYIIP